VLELGDEESGLESKEDVVGALDRMLMRPGLVHRAVPSPHSPSYRPTPLEGEIPKGKLRVIVDGRCFDRPISGTQVQIISMVAALSRREDLEVVFLGEGLHETVARVVRESCPDVPIHAESNLPWKADVFHRPYQIFHAHELSQCLGLATRFVLTQQDMIMARSPEYHRRREDWDSFIRAQNVAHSVVDEVGFFSLHAAVDTLSDGLLDPARATVIPLATDYQPVAASAPLGDVLPAKAGRRPILLILGASFAHKNREWGLRLFLRLAERGWDGVLVLAGGHPEFGSSALAEREILDAHPEFADRVVDLGHIDEDQKTALYRGASLVLYPSLYEGFGLIPFEAAALGTACVYSGRASMAEFLPTEGMLPSFRLDPATEYVLDILSSVKRQAAIVNAINASGVGLTWERTADAYVELYRRAVAQPPRTVDRHVFDEVVWSIASSSAAGKLSNREEFLVDVYRRRPSFRRLADMSLELGLGARHVIRSIRHRRH
jgi:glycosyltransferase involved in cell wall biosynthesis